MKKQQIAPKIWPKEMTFEEFKNLNPGINENKLIPYYHKYLQEFLNDNSRHLKHFNDTKQQLSEEIRLLKNKVNWDYDGDQTVGPTGAGREFRSPLNSNVNSLHFDGVDDAVGLDIIQEGRMPANGTLKPYKGLTVAAWINTSYIGSTSATSAGTYIIATAGDSATGWRLYSQNHRLHFHIFHDKGFMTPLGVILTNTYKGLLDRATPSQDFREDGWHYVVGTWDGKTQTLWLDGKEANGNGTADNQAFNHKLHTWDAHSGSDNNSVLGTNNGLVGGFGGRGVGFSRIEMSFDIGEEGYPELVGENDYQTESGSIASLFYAIDTPWYTFAENSGLVNASIGRRANTSDIVGEGHHIGYSDGSYSGSISEVAIWDTALDATTINELWHNGISGSAPKFDLTYIGYNNGENNHTHPYDVDDEGLSYKNVGRYSNSLQGWWKLEEGSGLIAYDSSGKNRNGELVNTPAWSGSYNPGPY